MTADRDTAAPRFAADRTLIRLVRWLRLMGADVLCDQKIDAAATLKQARIEGRRMLTRDKRLRTASDVLYLDSDRFREQIRAVMARWPFDPLAHAFTRCTRCNEPVRAVAREALVRRVPPFVYASNERLGVCDGCGRVYWNATHPERVLGEIASMGLGAPRLASPSRGR